MRLHLKNSIHPTRWRSTGLRRNAYIYSANKESSTEYNVLYATKREISRIFKDNTNGVYSVTLGKKCIFTARCRGL